MQSVSDATGHTAHAMEHVAEFAGGTGKASHEVLTDASGVGGQAVTLRGKVDQFLAAVLSEDGQLLAATGT